MQTREELRNLWKQVTDLKKKNSKQDDTAVEVQKLVQKLRQDKRQQQNQYENQVQTLTQKCWQLESQVGDQDFAKLKKRVATLKQQVTRMKANEKNLLNSLQNEKTKQKMLITEKVDLMH